MSETMENRGSKRACLESQAEATDNILRQWSRMFSKVRCQMHLEQLVKVLISLAIPLMATIKQVLAVMIRVADPEEMEVIQDMVNNMVQEKKLLEKGQRHKTNKNVKSSPKSKASTSVGSFEVISEVSPRSRKSKSTSSNQMTKMCFCGLTPNLLVCRKEGPNFMRRFYRCPKPYQHQTQCDYFAWTEDTKAEEYEKLYTQSVSMGTPTLQKTTKKKSKQVSETESATSSGDDVDLNRSPTSASPKTPPRPQRCQHEWNRRGTNAYVKVKTCHLCGLKETFRYKDGAQTTTYVDVSKLKKSGRPRTVSP